MMAHRYHPNSPMLFISWWLRREHVTRSYGFDGYWYDILARDKLDRVRLKKFYELASKMFSPPLTRAMDFMRNDNDPATFIFRIIGQSSQYGPIPLKELLIQICEKWYQIAERRGLEIACPISFAKEIVESCQQVAAWADAYTEFDSLRT